MANASCYSIRRIVPWEQARPLAAALLLLWLNLLPGTVRTALSDPAEQENHSVGITSQTPYVDLPNIHHGKTIRLQRNQDTENTIEFDFSFTSRPCPPYCIQPMNLSPGVETLGELELIDYLTRMSNGDDTILVIDSRTGNWLEKGMVPGAISIPWTLLHYKHASKKTLMELLEFQFGVSRDDNLLNFEHAKTLVFYCNGYWCGQSPTNIRSLLLLGYPAHKLKWYRGGMQAWMGMGLTTVPPPASPAASIPPVP
jgi:rhodanese-related sulfurtransferase